MRNRTRTIAAAAAVTAASPRAAPPRWRRRRAPSPAPRKVHVRQREPGHDAMVAAVAGSCTSARPGSARRSSRCSWRATPTRRRRPSRRPPVRSASAPSSCPPRSRTAKQSLAGGAHAQQGPAAPRRPGGSKSAEERQGHDAMVAAVAGSCTSARPGSARRSGRCSRRARPTRRRRSSRRPPVRSVSVPSSCPPRSCMPSRAWPEAADAILNAG